MNHSLLPDDMPEAKEAHKHPYRGYLIFALKLCFMGLVFWLVFNNIDFDDLKERLSSLPIAYVAVAIFTLNIGQIVSGMRMRYYFGHFHQIFPVPFSVALYYVGAFYSIILPGGVSGDGYRAYLLKKIYAIPVKSCLRLVICERASGMFMLCSLAIAYALFSQAISFVPYGYPLAIAAFIILIPSYFFSAKYILRDPPKIALGAAGLSLIVQLSGSISAFAIFSGLDVPMELMWDYLFIFMLSSMASILPISVGGAGVRELTFTLVVGLLHEFGYDALHVEIGVAAALTFFGVTVVTSLIGAGFIHQLEKLSKKPSPTTTQQESSDGTS